VVVPRPEIAAAIGSLLEADPARIVALTDSLRGPDRLVESTVQGRSMGTTLPPGSRIRIELAQRSRYKPGEIVAFLAGTELVVHRLLHWGCVGAARGSAITRGDAPLVPDPPVRHDRILGPVIAVRRGTDWVAPKPACRRRTSARILAALLSAIAIGALHLSPGLASTLLGVLRRAEGAVRRIRVRNSRHRTPEPPTADGTG